MQIKTISLLIVIFSLFGTALIPQSYAGGVTPSLSASECSGVSEIDIFIADEPGGERSWAISNHIVSLDSSFGPWQKNLIPIGMANVLVDDSSDMSSDQTFFDVTETITVGANGEPFTDWHEVIVTPGWTWEFSDVTTSFMTTVDDTVDGNVLTLLFNPPLPPGTEFTIEKTLVFVGPDGVLDSNPIDTSSFSDINPIIISQYPTGNISCEPNGEQPVGGEIIPIELTSLVLANAQTNSLWILPLLISIVAIGVLFLRKK